MSPTDYATSFSMPVKTKCPFATIAKFLKRLFISRTNSPEAVTRRWLEDIIVREHAELGRAGHVCPFVRQSLNHDRTVFEKLDSSDPDVIYTKVLQLGVQHLSLPASKQLLNTIVLALPRISRDSRGFVRLMHLHSKLKPHFTKRGQMLGEFHPLHNGEGIHNPGFRPLRSPIPLLVIRHMVPSDILFLSNEPLYLQHFLERFGLDDLSPDLRVIAERGLGNL